MTKMINECLANFLNPPKVDENGEIVEKTITKDLQKKVLREAKKLTGDNKYNRFGRLLQEIEDGTKASFSRDELSLIKEAAAIVYRKNIVKQKQIAMQVNAMKSIRSNVDKGFEKLKNEEIANNQSNVLRKFNNKDVNDLKIRQQAYFAIFSNLAGGKKAGFFSMETTKKSIEREISMKLPQIINEAGGALRRSNTDLTRERSRLFYIEAFGGDSGNPEIKAMYKEYKEFLDDMLKKYRESGVDISELDFYNIFQKHDIGALNKYGRDEWNNFLMDTLDWEKMTFRDGEKIPDNKRLKVLNEAFDTLTTKGLNKANDVSINEETGGIKGGKGRTSLATDLSQPRFLIFKDADSQFRYNEKFGTGNVFQTIHSLAMDDATNINLLRNMGPDPDKTFSFIEKSMIKDGIPENGIKEVWKQYAEIDPRQRSEGAAMISVMSEIFRNLAVFSKIPSLVISSISDLGYAGSEKALRTADKDDKGLTGGIKKAGTGLYFSVEHTVSTVKGMLKNFDKLEREDQIKTFGVIEGFNWKMGRYVGQAEAVENTIMPYNINDGKVKRGLKNAAGKFNNGLKRVNNWHYKLSLMNDYAQNAKVGITLEIFKDITMFRNKSFDSINDYYREIFDTYGFTREDFDNLKKFEVENYHGFEIMTFNSLGKYSDMDKKTATDLQRKIFNLVEVMSQRAYIEPSNYARTILKPGKSEGKGSFTYQLGQSAAQFKTFGLTYMMQRIAPLYNSKSFLESAGTASLGWFVALPYGYASYNMQNIINGITPEPINEENYYKVAFRSWMTTGGGGTLGDVVFGDAAAGNQKDILDWAFGPTGAAVKNLFKNFYDTRDSGLSAEKEVNTGKKITELVNFATATGDLWYLKLAKKYYIDNVLNEALNEKYWEEKERQRKKLEEKGQENYIYDLYRK